MVVEVVSVLVSSARVGDLSTMRIVDRLLCSAVQGEDSWKEDGEATSILVVVSLLEVAVSEGPSFDAGAVNINSKGSDLRLVRCAGWCIKCRGSTGRPRSSTLRSSVGAVSEAVRLARAEARSCSVLNKAETSPMVKGLEISLERRPRDRGDFCDSERLMAGRVSLSWEVAEGDSTSQLLGT